MKIYEEIFKLNSEENLISAVKNGMNVYLRRYEDKYGHETFFEAAVRYGTPALVHACIDMGADVNCVQDTSLSAKNSSLVAAMNAYNAPALRTLLERGAKTDVLNGLRWDTQKNLFPEFPQSASGENARNIKQRLDAGAEILKILREFGFRVPGLGGDGSCEDMSLHSVFPLSCSSDSDADDEDDSEDNDRFSEVMDHWEWDGFSFPALGTRPGAPWHAVSPEALKLMIGGGADVNARSAPGWTAMHYFSYSCCDYDLYYDPNAMLQILIDNGADINARGWEGMTPLMLAAMNVRKRPKALETVKLLLKNGADFDAKDDGGGGVLYWIRDFWYGNGFEKVILNEILFELCYFAQPDKVKAKAEAVGATMERSPVPLSAPDLDLMTAAFWGTPDDIAPILARGANVGARTQHEYTALMFSSVWNHAPASKFLIEQGAELDAKNDRKNTPLMLAMQTRDFQMIKTLLEAGANLREANGFGMTPLMIFIINRCCENMADFVKDFIDAGADVNAKNNNGMTALMYLARQSRPDTDVARALLDAGADVNAKNDNGTTALMCVAGRIWPDAEVARVLLDAGADVNTRDNGGRTALEIALNEASKPGDFVKLLLSSGANPRLMPIERLEGDEREGWMAGALREAGLKPGRLFRDVFALNSAEAITAAVKNGLDLSLKNYEDDENDDDETFFDAVLRYGAPETVQACVDRGVDVNEGWMLYKAIKARNAGAVEVLLKAGANADIFGGADADIEEGEEWYERTNIFPEGSAADADEAAKALKDRLDAGAKILKMLREAGASVPYSDGEELTYHRVEDEKGDQREPDTVTAIKRAVSPEALKRVLAAGADENARGDNGCIAMHFIARDWGGYFNPQAMIKILIAAGAKVDRNLMSLLGARANDYPDAWKTILHILETDANFSARRAEQMRDDIQKFDSESNLAKALRLESFDALTEALDKQDKKDDAHLFIAAGWGNAAEIESELVGGAQVNAATGKGYTPLMFAAALGNSEAFQCLLGKGADVNAENSQRESTLTLAIRAGFATIAQRLVAAGANVNVRDLNGDSLLFYTELDEATATALIKAGADLDAKNDNGDTALKRAMRSSRFKIVRALLAAGADPTCLLDDEGRGLTKDESEREDAFKRDFDKWDSYKWNSDKWDLDNRKEIDRKNEEGDACLRQYGLI